VQEAVLNPDVMFYCGQSEISWPRLHLAIQALPEGIWNDTPGRKLRKSLQKLGDLWRTWSYLGQTMSNCELFDLLDSFHHFECQVDKDRIYALAGLASDVRTSTELMPFTAGPKKMTVVPDYSLSDEDVFCQVALQRMQSGRAFTTLSYAGALRLRDGIRPISSWAPDFRLSKLWRTMLKEPDSKYQPEIELRSDGKLTLKGKVRVPFVHGLYSRSSNKWNSCTAQHIFPGPGNSEPQTMMEFFRDCLRWMYAIPTQVDLEKDTQRTALFDVLGTVASELCKEQHDGLTGRCVFVSNTVTISKRWGSEDSDGMGGWQNFGIGLLGIGPGDMAVGDVIVRFAGVEEALFFRSKDGGYQVLGDGRFTVLPPRLKNEFWDSGTEIVLV
jgi:hypothetical protein